jgi:predicted AAA+ superfamily ATPase
MGQRKRWLSDRVERGLGLARVVVVTGPRQSGKTTLVRSLVASGGTFRRLDDAVTLQAAQADPIGFASYGAVPRAIDEIQLGGDALIRAIKTVVDDDPAKGQFLLDGSADFLTVPGLSESLAGRAVFYELLPFSQGEIEGVRDDFVRRAFAEPDSMRGLPTSQVTRADYLDRIVRGGFPEASVLSAEDRGDWFDGLILTVTQRDITALTNARRSNEVPSLLRLLAARTASELVVSQVHADSGLGRDTTADYIGFLEMTYMIHKVPAWSTNFTTRARRTPKTYVLDSGLAAHLLGADVDGLSVPEDQRRGPLTETFVIGEVKKQLAWSGTRAKMFHFRDQHGAEVDLILERPDGRLVAIEVKAAATAQTRDFKHLAALRDKLGSRFVHGFVLSMHPTPVSFGDRLTGLPIAAMWETG